MSRDLDRICKSGPLSVCWRPGGESDPLQRERERDCPLTRYAIGRRGLREACRRRIPIGIGVRIGDQNLALGAVPSDGSAFPLAAPAGLPPVPFRSIEWRGSACGWEGEWAPSPPLSCSD